ncbi:MAG: hypothetical protein ABSG17_11275 [Spirochaetia bacterium]|jgi:hypothetical protein
MAGNPELPGIYDPGVMRPPGITTLRPERVDFSEELRAAEASDRNTAKLTRDVEAAVTGIGRGLANLGEMSAMAQAKKDAMDARFQVMDSADKLVQSGKYSFKDTAPEGYGGDPFAQAAGVQTQEGKELQLDDSFQQSVEEMQQKLSDKYRNHPKAQSWILDQFSGFSEQAYKQAHKTLADQYRKDGLAAVKESIASAEKAAFETGDYKSVDALWDTSDFHTESEKMVGKEISHHRVDHGYVLNQGLTAYQNGGLPSAKAAVEQTGKEKEMPLQERLSIMDLIGAQDAKTMKQVTDAVKQARADPSKSKTDAANDIERQFGAPAAGLTFQLRVEDEVKGALTLMKAGHEAEGQQLIDKIGQDNHWGEREMQYAGAYAKNEFEGFKRKDHGTAKDILTWGSQELIDIERGKVNANDALAALASRAFDGKARDVYGDQSARVAMSLAKDFVSGGGLGPGGTPKRSDDAALVYFTDGIVGKNLTAAEITQKEHELNAAVIDHKLTGTHYLMFSKELMSVNDPMLRETLDVGKVKFTDKNGVLDKAGYAEWAGDYISALRGEPTKDIGERRAIGQGAMEARDNKIARDTLTPPGTNVTRENQILVDRAVATLAKSWNLTEIPAADIVRGVQNPKTGQAYPVAVKRTIFGAEHKTSHKWYVPTFDQNGVAVWNELK